MDGQRWHDDGSFGEDSNRYGGLDDNRYAQPDDFNPYGDRAPSYTEPQSYTEPPTYTEQAPGPVRRTRAAQQRRGQRSGLIIPDATPAAGFDGSADFDDSAAFDGPDRAGYEVPETYQRTDYDDDPVRLTALDRQELRERGRDRGAPSAPPFAPPPPPAGPGTVFHAPTAAIPAPAQVAPTATYRSRRPGLAVLLAFAGVFAELILIKVLLANLFDSTAAAISGTMGSLFAIAGVPMVILGLYGLATGAATAAGPQSGRAWLRTPLAYLPVGLILIIAAGLAA